MDQFSRREFVLQGGLGLAVLGAGGWVLRGDARPTPASGKLGAYRKYLKEKGKPAVKKAGKWQPTEDNILGPFYRKGAPYRAKITPPLEPGVVLVIKGRVWGFDTKKPLVHATLDIWQANAKGRYDNDDPNKPPAKDVFVNRARLITDENGYYEYETIFPGPYKIGENTWRPSHIHYLVRHPGYKQLITQLYFKGDPHNKTDEFIKESLIIELSEKKAGKSIYKAGTFDIVLAPAARKNG
jgi:protocatechuate 3,4-dioxygenase beta subunit